MNEAGKRGREYRSTYILEGYPRTVKGQQMRHVLVTDPHGRQSVAAEVPDEAAMDVLEALRKAYEQGREDNAQAYAGDSQTPPPAPPRALCGDYRPAEPGGPCRVCDQTREAHQRAAEAHAIDMVRRSQEATSW